MPGAAIGMAMPATGAILAFRELGTFTLARFLKNSRTARLRGLCASLSLSAFVRRVCIRVILEVAPATFQNAETALVYKRSCRYRHDYRARPAVDHGLDRQL